MKLAVAFVVLLAGAFALPQAPISSDLAALEDAIIERKDERLIDGIIIRIIEGIIESIKEAGLDPLHVKEVDLSAEPVDGLRFFLGGEELFISGISDIVINRVSLSLLTLTFDFSLPRVSMSLAHGYAGVTIASTTLDGDLSGDVAIIQPRITGRARVGAVGGIQIRDLTTEISLQAIESNLNLRVLNEDLSEQLNNFLSVTIPGFIDKHNNTINDYVSRILFFIINLIV